MARAGPLERLVLRSELPACGTERLATLRIWVTQCSTIRTVQELLGHKSIKTTMIYTNVLNKGGRGVTSPVDVL